VPAHEANAVQYAGSARVDGSRAVQEFAPVAPTQLQTTSSSGLSSRSVTKKDSATGGSFRSSAETRGSDYASLAPRRADDKLSIVSGAIEVAESDLEPFPAFDPEYLPGAVCATPTDDLTPRTLRESCRTVDTVASIGVAVPIKIPAISSPSAVYNGRRDCIQASQGVSSAAGDGEHVPVKDRAHVGWEHCVY